MPKNLFWIPKLLVAAGILFAGATNVVWAADITFLSGSALQSAMEVIIADFQKSSGHKVTVSYANVGTITDRIRKGEAADLAVISPQQWDALQKEGRLGSDFRLQFARLGSGVGVKKGAAKPDIRSADALRRTLLDARAVAINDPALGSPVGAHALRVFERLGIAANMKPKTKLFADSPTSFQAIANGEADLVITNANLIAASSQMDLVGGLPGDLQAYTVLVAGIPKTAGQVEAAKALGNFLITPPAAAAFKARGIDPG